MLTAGRAEECEASFYSASASAGMWYLTPRQGFFRHQKRLRQLQLSCPNIRAIPEEIIGRRGISGNHYRSAKTEAIGTFFLFLNR